MLDSDTIYSATIADLQPTIQEEEAIRSLIAVALEEDRISSDITSLACIDPYATTSATLVLQQNEALIAGLPLISWILESIDPFCQTILEVQEGSRLSEGAVLATIWGKTRSLLSAERVMLNFIQHASGVATLTSSYVEAARETPCDILDTRKTLPGLRALQKYAVRIGGGKNHRYDLSERFLIKDNHIAALSKSHSRPISEAVRLARTFKQNILIEVEVENLSMFEEALSAGVDVIMLDNMPLHEIRAAVLQAEGKVYLEASGSVHLSQIRDLSATGVDGISIGRLTHSVPSVDIGIEFEGPVTSCSQK